MKKKAGRRLICDSEFQQLITPLTKEQYVCLEEAILRDETERHIVVWSNVIIDGYERYEICQKQGLHFATQRAKFLSRDDAISWICTRQIQREDLPGAMRKYLIGKRYVVEKRIEHAKKQYNVSPYVVNAADIIEKSNTKSQAGKRIAGELGMVYGTVIKYGTFCRAMDAIEQTDPELKQMILCGKCHVSIECVVKMAKMPEQEYRETRNRIIPHIHTGHEQDEGHSNLAHSIKEMPEYDPDADINGLVLTMPSWISSIERMRESVVSQQASKGAMVDLVTALHAMRDAIDGLLKDVEQK